MEIWSHHGGIMEKLCKTENKWKDYLIHSHYMSKLWTRSKKNSILSKSSVAQRRFEPLSFLLTVTLTKSCHLIL